MCGIVGYTGFKNAVDVVFDGLKTLEYRGYDSAGIAVSGKNIEVFKAVGRVSELKAKLPSVPFSTAIGHTRWATHGKPLEKNAHPHISFDGKVAVVHNGIIENFKHLKRKVEEKGISFASDTDSEIIAHLLALDGSADFLQAVENVSKLLKGAATFLAIREGDDKIYCSKCGASLTIGIGDGENFVASDTLAICEHTNRMIPLLDGDIAVISRENVNIFSGQERVFRPAYNLNRIRPTDSDCFMASEIAEIPAAVHRTIKGFLSNPAAEEKIKNADKLYFVGCGTAYHACLYAKYVFSRLLQKNCEAVESSEFEDALITRQTVAVFVTQSGETADTVLAAKRLRQQGGYAIAICNVQGSLISFEADTTYFTHAGAEVAVAATKSYATQLTLLYLLAKKCTGLPLDDFEPALVSCLEMALEQKISLPDCPDKNIFFIGKGQDLVTAKEAALKVKEITYKMTDAYPAGELKHGPIALIDDRSLAIVIATNEQDKARIEATTSELRSRGATVFAVSGIGDIGADKTVCLPALDDKLLFPLIAILPLQRFALDLSLALNLNPDKPRNLAKSVTVI
ncbi:MAG: glutamine--fructose-6-phosphate transaminase (isomerizing) [Clostridia bacterium]|nr:glutamine--fructose-6-phosphate transaminase (isomerizing) [Clostridia bacterium]